MRSALLFGHVMHSRIRPAPNRFRYRAFFMRIRLSELAAPLSPLFSPLFSVNRWNLFSFYYSDHGVRDGSPPEVWIRKVLQREGIANADGEIYLHAFPRMFGYVFNPVSFWLCHDKGGALRAVLCEVCNTFGEHHHYLLAHGDGRPIGAAETLTARKVFHVSPFIARGGTYRFQFMASDDAANFRIDYGDEAGPLLATAMAGSARAFDSRNLLRALLLYPWFTLAVVAKIHWQALKLWLKRVPFVRKPEAPRKLLSR